MKALRYGIGLALLTLGAGCTGGGKDAPAGSIEGTVVVTDQGPLAGATVTVLGHELTATTDANGDYSIEKVPVGDVFLVAEGNGSWGVLVGANVVEGVTSIDLELVPDSVVTAVAGMLGRTIDVQDGIFQVLFDNHAGGESASLTAPSDDPFTFGVDDDPVVRSSLLASGSQELIFSGMEPGTTGVTASSGCTAAFPGADWPIRAKTITSVWMDCVASGTTGTIAGTATDENGAALAGLTVTVTEHAGLTATTDANGDYAIQNVPVDVVHLLAGKTGYWSQLVRAEVEADQTTTVDPDPPSDAVVAAVAAALGRTIDPAEGIVEAVLENHKGGESVTLEVASDAPFTFDGSDSPVASDTLLASGDDALIFSGVAAGTASVSVATSGCVAAYPNAEWPVVARTITNVRVDCTGSTVATGSLQGLVTDADDVPLSGVAVSILEHQSLTAITDANGNYTIANVPVDQVHVVAGLAGHWSSLVRETVLDSQTNATGDLFLIPDALINDVATALSRTVDPANGIVIAEFDNHVGGEKATLSEASDLPFTFDAAGDPVESNELLATGETGLVFTNVAPGSVQVSVDAPACTAEFPGVAWPVQAKTFTVAPVYCP